MLELNPTLRQACYEVIMSSSYSLPPSSRADSPAQSIDHRAVSTGSPHAGCQCCTVALRPRIITIQLAKYFQSPPVCLLAATIIHGRGYWSSRSKLSNRHACKFSIGPDPKNNIPCHTHIILSAEEIEI